MGAQIRQLRKARGLTIDEAAKRAGLSRNTLSNVERSALPNPTLGTMLALMELFDLETIEGLIGPTPSASLVDEWIDKGRPGVR
jgi:transcriptional regulator with XRE-family HTH domain